jgi:hypothetical protein
MTRVKLHPLCLGRGHRSQQTNYFKNQKHSLESLQLVFGVIYDNPTGLHGLVEGQLYIFHFVLILRATVYTK